MQTYVTITPQFQVQIPVSVRQKSGLTKHGKAKMSARKGKIIIEPVKKDIMSWAGKFKVKHPLSAATIRDHIDYSQL